MTPTPPGFILNPVKNRTVAALVGAKTIGLILHVQAGNGALGGWFNQPQAAASSTWWAGKVGGREQYGNPDTDKFWAQADGNSTYHSIETEGWPNEPLTAVQIESVAQAFAWGHARYGWPLQLAEKPGQPGLGWHGMGGKAWGGHTGCPGDIRKAQRQLILTRAQQIAGAKSKEDDVTPDDIKQAVREVLKEDGLVDSRMFASNPTVAPVTALRYAMEWSLAARNAAQIAANAPGVSAQQIADAIPDDLAKQVVDALATRLKES